MTRFGSLRVRDGRREEYEEYEGHKESPLGILRNYDCKLHLILMERSLLCALYRSLRETEHIDALFPVFSVL